MSRQARLPLSAWCLLLLAAPAPAGVKHLDQGWSEEDRQRFYYLPQGSEIMPYAWFLALERAGGTELFRQPDHLASFRFLPNEKNPSNPDALPVGFARGKGRDGEDWFGLTCAACHTGELTYRGKRVRVDGGTTLADMIGFQSELVSALRATLADAHKYRRFAERVLGKAYTEDAARSLKDRARARLVAMADWEASSRPAHMTGFGNWDAVNILMNSVNATAIRHPDNNRTPQVPVSYPSIWLTDDMDALLWNASVSNVTLRQIGEVIIVFGRANVTATDKGFRFESSADVKALGKVYEYVAALKPPAWPADTLGAIDTEKAKRGAAIYAREGCAKCHGDRDAPLMTDPDPKGRRSIRVTRTPVAEVGTDPGYAEYFVRRTAGPGMLAPLFRGTAVEKQEVIPGAILFLATLTEITRAEVDRAASTPEERNRLLGGRPLPTLPKTKQELDALVQSLRVYKAGPLAGVWSTAPYLHNASVPSLYELLLPPDRRVRSFYLGDREFDPKRVGYKTEPFDGGYRYDTSLPGFSNRGHDYGTAISDKERWELLEYLKTF